MPITLSLFHCIVYRLAIYKLLETDYFSVLQFPNMGHSCFKWLTSNFIGSGISSISYYFVFAAYIIFGREFIIDPFTPNLLKTFLVTSASPM